MIPRKAPAATPTPAPAPAPAAQPGDDRPITPEQVRFFETKIRPVLMNKCAKCHASDAEKIKGGLLVDSREGLRKGGDTGPAVVPCDLEESLLITAIRYKDEAFRCPPRPGSPTRSSPTSRRGSRWVRPTPASSEKTGPATAAKRGVDRRQRPAVLGVPASAGGADRRRSMTRPGRTGFGHRSVRARRIWKPRGSSPWPTPTGPP